MTKIEIIDKILLLLPREDKTGKYHPRLVELAVESVLGDMYSEIQAVNPRLLDLYVTHLGTTTPITISQEAGTTTYYSTIPVKIYPVPGSASGVRHIYPRANTGNQFVPMDATEADLVFNTDVAVVTGKIGYIVRQGQRVDYWNSNAAVRASGVRMAVLQKFSEFADTDEVFIPNMAEVNSSSSLFDRVLERLGAVPPVDLRDNNAERAVETTNNRGN